VPPAFPFLSRLVGFARSIVASHQMRHERHYQVPHLEHQLAEDSPEASRKNARPSQLWHRQARARCEEWDCARTSHWHAEMSEHNLVSRHGLPEQRDHVRRLSWTRHCRPRLRFCRTCSFVSLGMALESFVRECFVCCPVSASGIQCVLSL
jgi:hypothetical protein